MQRVRLSSLDRVYMCHDTHVALQEVRCAIRQVWRSYKYACRQIRLLVNTESVLVL